MNLLPKTDTNFAKKEYWNSFFKNRQKEFEWYGEYPELCGYLHKYIKPKDSILVVGCGNSQLSANLYDVGYRNILNIDISAVAIKHMKQINKDRSEMRFEVADGLKTGLNDEEFTVVIDKGTLDALMPESSEESLDRGRQLLLEMGRLLKFGGRYVLISLLQEHILKTLLELFSTSGWLIRILRCHEVEERTSREHGSLRMPVFFVVVTKFKAGFKSLLEVGLTSDGAITRLSGIEEVLVAIKEIQESVAVFSYVQKNKLKEEMRLEFRIPSDESAKYTIYLLDKADDDKESYGIFIVPIGREVEWMFSTSSGRHTLHQSTPFTRLAVICLSRDHNFSSVKAIQDEFSAYAMQLTPPKHPAGVKIPFLSLGDSDSGLGQREVIYRGNSKWAGALIVEDVDVTSRLERKRRLIFTSCLAVVQSEARLIKKGKHWKVDHSYLEFTHHSYMAVGAALNKSSRILVLGLGGGCLATFLHNLFPSVHVVTVDIDEEVVHVARKYFELPNSPRLTVKVEDALEFVGHCEDQFDLILLDIDNKQEGCSILSPPLPFLEPTFLEKITLLLSKSGLFVINVVSRLEEDKKDIESKLKKQFNYLVRCHLEEDVNEIIYTANVESISFDAWKNNLLKGAKNLMHYHFGNKEMFDLNHFTRTLNIS